MAASDLLLDYRNPFTLRQIDLASVIRGEEGIVVEGSGAMRAVSRPAAAFIDDPDGNNFISALHLTDRVEQQAPHFVVSVGKGYVAGYRTVISCDGFWTIDQVASSEQKERDFVNAKRRDFQEEAPISWNAEKGKFVADLSARPLVEVEGPLVVLTSNEPSNYGSFLFRVIPKVLTALKLGNSVKFLVYAAHPNFQQLLELAGLPGASIILHDPRKIYASRQVILISNRNPNACLDHESVALFQRIRGKCLATGGTAQAEQASARLYVSRLTPDLSHKRPMQNETEVIEALVARGFTIVDPGTLDAVGQVLLFGRASLVVGPSGAAMFNAVFCRPGTRLVDIESEPHWIHAHAGLFGSCGLSFGIFEGTPADKDWSVHHKPWRVNLAALLERIDGLSAPNSEGAD